jgi:transcriptional regulator with XRE-family HTH domain
MREISWRELARELEISSSVFTRLAQGRQPDLETYLLMTEWLGVSADSFRGGPRPSEAESEDTVEKIASYLHADKALKPESAQAITRIVQAAYQEMANER